MSNSKIIVTSQQAEKDMQKKQILTAIGLITLGIIFGVFLVTDLGTGIRLGFAGDTQEVKLGGPVPIQTQNTTIRALSDNFIAVAKAVTPSVVGVSAVTETKGSQMPQDFFHFFQQDPNEPQQSQDFGSGVIITPDGYIVTNNHVVEGATKDGIRVTLSDKTEYKAKLVGTDPTTDLAVIKVEAKGLPAVAIGNSDNVQVGEWVLAIGNPLGFLTSTVTQGIVSALGRNIDIIRTAGRTNYAIENFIQTDAAINPGNSGGALVNMNGEMIGINAAIATTNGRFQGYGFAIPVNMMKTVASDLIRYGEVRRGYIGVQIKEVSQAMADALGLTEAKGVFVDGVQSGGAGEAAGLKGGDVILSIDGRETRAPNELQSYIATKHIGDEVTLKVFRDGKTIEKKVRLKARDPKATPVAERTEKKGGDAESAKEEEAFSSVGLTVRSLSAAEKKELDLDHGVVITEVKPFGEAAKSGLRQNMIVLDADRKPVGNASEFSRILQSKKSGGAILLRVRLDEETTSFLALQIPK
jgi:serine protease Do